MAKLDDIINQVMSELPKYTDDFNDSVNIVSASRSSKEITLTVDADLETDTKANIKGVYAELEITDVEATDEDDEWTLTTEADHDQTYSESEQVAHVEKKVRFVGSLSGEKNLVSVPANDQIVIENASEPTGEFYLLEDRNYSGWKTVVINNVNHTVKYSVDFEIDPHVVSGKVVNNIRVGCVASEQDIQDYLENKTESLTNKTLFVLMESVRCSKDTSIFSDSTNRKTSANDLHVEAIQTFSIFAVIPTQTNMTPREAVNYIYTLRPYIVKCLHGAIFDSGFDDETEFVACFTGDAGENFNKSYYVHRFDFEIVFNIGNKDAVPESYTKAFRSFEVDFKLPIDDYAEIKKEIEGNFEE
jgi:hypothetical protein